MAGLTPTPHASVYSATKAAVVALSEVMYFDLHDAGSRVGVSVLCPGIVKTNIIHSDRNRPDALPESGDATVVGEGVRAFFQMGDDPLDVADRVLRAAERDDFYVLTNESGRADIAARGAAIDQLGHPYRARPESVFPDHVIASRD
jgi:short-subunit dehydrogenase